jgi:hypothetical protein
MSEAQGNQLSVRLELQADCLSGVWAIRADRARSILEVGDLEEALRAAAAIGDDRLQKQARGYVTPDSFTHGSSEQRVRWFRRGLEMGKLAACDTFSKDYTTQYPSPPPGRLPQAGHRPAFAPSL